MNRSYTISSICSSGRKYQVGLIIRKTTYLTNHIRCVFAVYRILEYSLHSLVLLTDLFDAFFNPKNTSEKNATRNTPPT